MTSLNAHFGPYNTRLQAGIINNSNFYGFEPEDIPNECLKSLAFKAMNSRTFLGEGIQGTGQWMLNNKDYLSWHNSGGVLWVLCQDPQALSDFIGASCFAERCQTQGRPNEGWEWHERELREHGETALRAQALKGRNVLIYIDGLDERGEMDNVRLVKFFQTLSTSTKYAIKWCFSSRLHILTGAKNDFAIDAHLHNRKDIEIFLDDQLKVALLDRTNGGFLWIHHSADKIEEMMRKGESAEYILAGIEVLPEELQDIYQDILDGICTEVDIALQVFQWVTLAFRPLPLEDLSRVLCFTESSKPESQTAGLSWCVDSTTFEERVLRVTRGLVRKRRVMPINLRRQELRVTIIVPEGRNDEEARLAGASLQSQLLQHEQARQWSSAFVLDHESVYKFMARKGLQSLAARCKTPAVSISVPEILISLAKICLRYLLTQEVAVFADTRMREMGYLDDREPFIQTVTYADHLKAPPFALYAGQGWIRHAKAAEKGGASDDSMVSLFCLPGIVGWQEIERTSTLADAGVTSSNQLSVIHRLVTLEMPRTLDAILQQEATCVSVEKAEWLAHCRRMVNAIDGPSPPIILALDSGNEAVLSVLLRHDANVDHRSPDDRTTVLHFLSICGGVSLAKSLRLQLNSHLHKICTGNSPVLKAGREKALRLTRMLLAKTKVGVHSEDPPREPWLRASYETPLLIAWRYGTPEMVELLLSGPGVDGRFKDKDGLSLMHPISEPSHKDPSQKHEESCPESTASYRQKARVMINSGKFDLTLKAPYDAILFAYAVAHGAQDVVSILLECAVVDVEERDHMGNTPLARAILSGAVGVIELLIKSRRVDPNAKSTGDITPLALACHAGSLTIVKLLLRDDRTNRVEEIHLNRGSTIAAMLDGHTEVVKCMIEALPSSTVASFGGANALYFGSLFTRVRRAEDNEEDMPLAMQAMREYRNFRGQAVWEDEAACVELLRRHNLRH
ncbi:uncharacterized protein LTR77_002346 [Saxophila tyrrhenica]|uniref:Uncharacterized protein n=1 Tax=Saxophila tyrrhenica TaxID=1690608 RepID=A0AAV9PLE1_9PEZI|nr:hypothetical protein LTR77_002346 [Saxophila tyrrhenica]